MLYFALTRAARRSRNCANWQRSVPFPYALSSRGCTPVGGTPQQMLGSAGGGSGGGDRDGGVDWDMEDCVLPLQCERSAALLKLPVKFLGAWRPVVEELVARCRHWRCATAKND